MDSAAQILADATRFKREALTVIECIRAGTFKVANSHTPETALETLRASITDYDRVIMNYGSRDDA